LVLRGERSYTDRTLMLEGNNSIIGHSVVIHDAG
jgi:hypothetical protein